MSSTPFGEHLKRERELRGVSLQEISAATRISTRFLEAIESDRWEQLPGGVFNRGFIRSIARFLGLDEDSLVAEYSLGRTAGNQEVPPAKERFIDIPRNWKPAAVALLLIALLAAVCLLTYHFYGPQIRARLHGKLSGVHTEDNGGPALRAPSPPNRTDTPKDSPVQSGATGTDIEAAPDSAKPDLGDAH